MDSSFEKLYSSFNGRPSEISYTLSKRKSILIEIDEGREFVAQSSSTSSKINFERYTLRYFSKGGVFVEGIIRTIENLPEKLVFVKGTIKWIEERNSVTRQHNIAKHSSTKIQINPSIL